RALFHPKRDRLAEEIRLANRVTIRVKAANFRRVRGDTVVAAICDEIAFWQSGEDSANPDTEILAAIRPAMLTVPGALLLGLSSPFARRGVLWEAFRHHYGRDDDPVLVWKAATADMHPRVDRTEIARAYAEDPIAARAEYGAQFREDVDAYVTEEVVEANVV